MHGLAKHADLQRSNSDNDNSYIKKLLVKAGEFGQCLLIHIVDY